MTATLTRPKPQVSMSASVPAKTITNAVRTVAHAVSGRSSLPILSHLLIKAEGDCLRLFASDLELSISCQVPALVSREGDLTAPAKTITETLGHFNDAALVEITSGASETVSLYCEKSKMKLLGLDAASYPAIPDVSDNCRFSIVQSTLREALRQVAFAVSTDETRAIITGVYLRVSETEGSLLFVATDTHRLAMKNITTATDIQEDKNVIIPIRAVNEVLRSMNPKNDAEAIRVHVGTASIRFLMPGEEHVVITSRLIEGQYPNYQRIIPTDSFRTLSMDAKPLTQALKRAFVVARENANRVILQGNGSELSLTAESQIVGAASENLGECDTTEPFRIAFNVKYLLDALGVVESDQVTLELQENELKPAKLKYVLPESDSAWLCVLMPMQIV